MKYSKIIVTKTWLKQVEFSADILVITFEELKHWVLSGKIFWHLFGYSQSQILTYRVNVLGKPFLSALLIRLLSRGKSCMEDEQGKKIDITFGYLCGRLLKLINDWVAKPLLLKKIKDEIEQKRKIINAKEKTNFDIEKTSVYLRTDLAFGIRSGGSVGHIAGVLNNLDAFSGSPVFISSDYMPTIRKNVVKYIIDPEYSFWDFKEMPSLYYNMVFYNKVKGILAGSDISFFYQRYSVNNYSGVCLAMDHHVPFVLEYNGSEIWIAKNWGRPLKHERLSQKIELLNLHAADLIVVVSQPMKNELVERGINSSKILVNPNGVEPEHYSPAVDGSIVRTQYGFSEKRVIGFIGTFGKWHGAEVLAEAFGILVEKYPEYKKDTRLILIGDGVNMSLVKEILNKHNIEDICVLTGLIPQEEGPAYLAVCDILASPHVPNPDGTPFFGSPTKLFEYMAMGKGIVASDLDQIGDVLEHGKTAWMVNPGDPEYLAEGLKHLLDNQALRKRLGENARKEAISKYTWKEHTQRIIAKLEEVL
ncbi:glycosyltransferase [bacterium]|nr:glycosyltransferase [bacterium]